MRKIQKFLHLAVPFIIISIVSSIFIDIKLVLTIILIILLIMGYSIYKEKIGQELIIAFLFALVLTSYYIYEYTTQNIILGRINIFPLVTWTAGLVLLREIYENIKIKNKFTIISLIYLIGLFILEYIGFYLLKIQLKTNFPSLLGIGIIHAQLGMKFFYIFAGPLYILITDYLKVK